MKAKMRIARVTAQCLSWKIYQIDGNSIKQMMMRVMAQCQSWKTCLIEALKMNQVKMKMTSFSEAWEDSDEDSDSSIPELEDLP